MIQDIQPHVYHNEYTPHPPKPEDTVFIFRDNTVLVRLQGDTVIFPIAGQAGDMPLQYLFCVDEASFYLGQGQIPGYTFQPLRLLRNCQPQHLCFAGVTAWHLYHWYDTQRFCGKCASKLHHHHKLRAMECHACGNLVFPVIAPAVIVAVTDGDKILLTRYAGREHKGFALIAGFCEIGERAEDTVHREVMEEAGVRVKNLRYFGSQPWGFASNLLLGFFCELDGDPQIHMDEEELQFAQWISREDLPVQENLASLTATMIEHFRKGKS